MTAKRRGGIDVAVHANWDFNAAAKYLTPGGTGDWGRFRFRSAGAISHPDFALILNSPSEDVVPITLAPERIWFAAGEPPEFKAYHAGQGRGTVLVTCDASLASNPPAGRQVIVEPPVLRTWHVHKTLDELAGIRAVEKTRTLSWVTSSKSGLPGHKRRLCFLAAIRDKLPLDLYGRGFKAIEDKWDGVAPYRYGIAFENARWPHYFTEKIMDCFVCLTLPLYYGCPEIHKYFPAKSFVAIEPGDPRCVDKIRDIIASDLWQERQEALQEAKWLVLHKYNMFSQLARLMTERLGPAGAPETLHVRRTECDHG